MSSSTSWIRRDEIRSMFSRAMSDMYRDEVPLYGQLLDLVAQVNAQTLGEQPALNAQLFDDNELERLNLERHGAIRLGTAEELFTARRLFAVMGMEPVGYYDLSVAGVPVHATAFRAVDKAELNINPFRVFTSLLRLELIADAQLRGTAKAILSKRQIYSPRALELMTHHEQQGGLNQAQAHEFVSEAIKTFRWHNEATVDLPTYEALSSAHKLIADVVCFRGPHINHLTPRTLNIDQAQQLMPQHGMDAKDVVEGPPARQCPILLRQTSFKALQETVLFDGQAGMHTARFGEIEQRGIALTRKGRALYDQLLQSVRSMENAGSASTNYGARLSEAFASFPDDWTEIRKQGLGYFQYFLTDRGAHLETPVEGDLEDWISAGWVRAAPIVYEDFLPVSAAGIFQSNLHGQEQKHYAANADQLAFERDLGTRVRDEFALYEAIENASRQALHNWAREAAPVL